MSHAECCQNIRTILSVQWQHIQVSGTLCDCLGEFVVSGGQTVLYWRTSAALVLVLSSFWMDHWNLLVKVLICHRTRWQVVYLFSCLHPSEVIVTNAVVLMFLSLTLDCLIWIVD